MSNTNKNEILLIENRKTVRNKKAIKRVQEMLRSQFPGLEKEFIDNLPINIFGGTKMGFRYRLFISQNTEKEINGFMFYSHFPRNNFYFLDNMATGPGLTNQGIGSELYRFLRQEAKKNDGLGIFFECKSDEADSGFGGEELKQNILRLKFYERFGARPITNNQYNLKVNEKDNSTLLVFDPLDIQITLTRDLVRKIAKKIILKKYSDFCPPEYIKTVVMSFTDNPIKMREPRYTK